MWRPIEEAPKGEVPITGFIPLPTLTRPVNYRILTLMWDDGGVTGLPAWRTTVHPFTRFEPTHWQPLPPPPETSE